MTTTTPSSVLAIIPARAGSKRLKNKNMLTLGDYPLIQWTIQAAQESNCVTDLVVNSDDPQIEALCDKLEVPFLKRPEALAQDNSSSVDVIIHTLEEYSKQGRVYDYILLLQPTSPFRTSRHIQEAFTLLEKRSADSVISICESSSHPFWSKALDENLDISNMIDARLLNKRKQDLPVFYSLNGALYFVKSEELLQQKSLFLNKDSFGYLMNQEDSVDIDTALDFKFAQFLIETNK